VFPMNPNLAMHDLMDAFDPVDPQFEMVAERGKMKAQPKAAAKKPAKAKAEAAPDIDLDDLNLDDLDE